jgi:hypothetical protein
MSGAISPLPQYAFMAWCSVKAQGQLYLYHYSILYNHPQKNPEDLMLEKDASREWYPSFYPPNRKLPV